MAGFYQLSYIAAATNGTTQQNWVPNATALIQAVLGPLYACHAPPTLLQAVLTFDAFIRHSPLTPINPAKSGLPFLALSLLSVLQWPPMSTVSMG